MSFALLNTIYVIILIIIELVMTAHCTVYNVDKVVGLITMIIERGFCRICFKYIDRSLIIIEYKAVNSCNTTK